MITAIQVSVPTTGAVPLVLVPPGVCTLIISNPSASNTLAVGTTTNVTTTNGGLVPNNASVSLSGFAGSAATQLYAIAGTGPVNVGVFLSTPK